MIDKETELYVGYIECITNTINNKKYIGQTIKKLQTRFDEHIDGNKNMDHPQAIDLAIQKYGEDKFKFEQLIKIVSDTKESVCEELDRQEIFCIDWYKSMYTQYGYNIDRGGSSSSYLMRPVDVYDYYGNYIRSFESCSEAGRYYDISDVSVCDCCSGKTKRILCPEIVFRYKEERFDKYQVFDENFKVYQFSLDGELIKEYPSASVAARAVGGYASNISYATLHKNTTAYGYYWSKNNIFDFNKYNHGTNIYVDQYSINGELLNTFESLAKAAISLGKNAGCSNYINQGCKGEILYPIFGFIWRHHGDPFHKYPIRDIFYNKKSVDQ